MRDLIGYKNKHYYTILKNYMKKESDIIIINNLTSQAQCKKAYKILRELGVDTREFITIMSYDYSTDEDLYNIREKI